MMPKSSMELLTYDLLDKKNGLKSTEAADIFYGRVKIVRLWQKMKRAIEVLDKTETLPLERFLDIGGWELINAWLDRMQNLKTKKPEPKKPSMRGSAALVQVMILQLITKCSITMNRLFKMKSAIVYELFKSSDDKTHQLAKEVLKKWSLQNIMKNLTAQATKSPDQPKQVDQRKPLSSKILSSQSNISQQKKSQANNHQQDENIDVRSKALIVTGNRGTSNGAGSVDEQSHANEKNRNTSQPKEKNLNQPSGIRSNTARSTHDSGKLPGNDNENPKEKSTRTLKDYHASVKRPTTIIEKVIESADDIIGDCVIVPEKKDKTGNVSAITPTKSVPEPVDHSEDTSDSIIFIEEFQRTSKGSNSIPLATPKRSASSLDFSGRLRSEGSNDSMEENVKRMKKERSHIANANTDDIEMPEITPYIGKKISPGTSSADEDPEFFNRSESSTSHFKDRSPMRHHRSVHGHRRTVDHGSCPYYNGNSSHESQKDIHAHRHDQDYQNMHHCFNEKFFNPNDADHCHRSRCKCPAYYMMKFMSRFMSCHHSCCGRT